jgi:protein-S-isoprenylcysteine O-methyltransferase Ste14
MKSLELKIPPPAIAILVAVGMWLLSTTAPPLHLPAAIRVYASLAIALMGIGMAVSGVVAFRRAKTTVNPTKPETTSSLVSSGIYRVTRNPMYTGLLFVLFAWAIYLSSAWALLGPVCFVLYIGRFQIAPEERALSALFGDAYAAYKSRVRRWL